MGKSTCPKGLKLLPSTLLLFQDLNSPDVYETSDLPESEQNVQTEQVITLTLYVSGFHHS